ncbi:TetR/AcrR family transcriptional regulator [Streptomyces hoynatensis]|uniref:TetR/AcrR family transcriptional regulator n=1 Tax=Streptomyces hoynatensis TaxID=1141874 RepID=A0A3A9YTB9_9ACTN|nr:TetR/AcrR family transcriptional regulator [Streptomyces hoynatensis]RKN39029.1 TetR/AcrR family transcriptional regulator [Streptomyces hoynatensis]
MRNVERGDLTGRARLRDAALELFAERGFEATSTRAVAAAAGLSPALVTRHFGSKEGLRAAVDEHVLALFGRALAAVRPGERLMESLGEVSARLFGADPVLRGYLRHSLIEGGRAGEALFGRLLAGAKAELSRLDAAHGGGAADAAWAPFQLLSVVLGPLLLERVAQPHLAAPMFGPEALAERSAANQRLLLRGWYGRLEERSGAQPEERPEERPGERAGERNGGNGG